jgi:hypothetical protein
VKSNTAPLSSGRKVISMLPILREVQAAGARTLAETADALNTRGVPTPRELGADDSQAQARSGGVSGRGGG